MTVRTLLVWCPDWPVIAAELTAGVSSRDPVAVLRAGRVVACSPAARVAGVARGLRKREAQSRCPELVVMEHDQGRDARAFEPVVAAVEHVVAGVEVVAPGSCALAVRGPARYFGSEEAAAERIVEQVGQECGVEARVGIADGVFAAGLAARAGRIVPPGGTATFLSGVDIRALERPGLTDLLRRLGVRTLGEFAALPAGDVLTRFGFDAALAHRLAAGADERPLMVRRPPPELTVDEEYEEPLERVDVASFAARALAQRLHERLAAHGLACTRLVIEAVTSHGYELRRSWRHDGLLSAAAIGDRVRWQLEGWLSGPRRVAPGRRDGADRRDAADSGAGRIRPAPLSAPSPPATPTASPDRAGVAGIRRLRLIPEGVLAHAGLQPGLWGESGEGRERANRALARVQGLLGPDSVLAGVLVGGRSPADQVRMIPWNERVSNERVSNEQVPWNKRVSNEQVSRNKRVSGDVRVPGDKRVPGNPQTSGNGPVSWDGRIPGNGPEAPWPGQLPAPAPATVLPEPVPVTVHDAQGRPVTVTARLAVSAPPRRLTIADDPPAEIAGWAGPWPVDERWWAPAESRRQVRFQAGLTDGRALLLALSDGEWSVTAVYD